MNKFILFITITLFLIGCEEEPSKPNPPSPGTVRHGVYVLNEGLFGDPSGARLSLYDIDNDLVFTDVIESSNRGLHLGSVGDDMKLVNGKLYIALSGSNNINVIRLPDHTQIQSAYLPGSAPHDLAIDEERGKLYVTRLFKNSIIVLNLGTLSYLDSINVGANPQGMVISHDKLFVCNSGFSGDSTISIIDITADSVISTMEVGVGPTGITISNNNKALIACSGNAFGTPPSFGSVVIMNPMTNTVEDSIQLAVNLFGGIVAYGDYAYVLEASSASYYGGSVHRIRLSTKEVTLNFISGIYYAIAIDTNNGDLYLTDVKEFSSDGEVKVFSNAGVHRKSFAAQKGPGVIVLKE